jgi:phospholipase/carboxylesterase
VNDVLAFGAPLEGARLAVILLHGRGSSAEDIAGLADALPSAGVAYLAPSADGGQWYPQRFFVPLAQNEPYLTQALDTVEACVEHARAAEVPLAKIGLIGFSQGACLALEFAARNPERYAFVGGLSGGLIGPLGLARKAFDLQDTPVLLGCAERDPHIPLEHVEESARILAQSRAKLTKHIFPGGAHTVFPEEIRWLTSVMAST